MRTGRNQSRHARRRWDKTQRLAERRSAAAARATAVSGGHGANQLIIRCRRVQARLAPGHSSSSAHTTPSRELWSATSLFAAPQNTRRLSCEKVTPSGCNRREHTGQLRQLLARAARSQLPGGGGGALPSQVANMTWAICITSPLKCYAGEHCMHSHPLAHTQQQCAQRSIRSKR